MRPSIVPRFLTAAFYTSWREKLPGIICALACYFDRCGFFCALSGAACRQRARRLRAGLLPTGVSLRSSALRRGPQSYAIFSRMPSQKLFLLVALLTFFIYSDAAAQKLVPHPISLANGNSFDLNLPADYDIRVAAQGLKRVRFMALSPDNRLFVTDMYNLTDNIRGVVYILDQFDQTTERFKKVTKYLSNLH